MKKKTILSALLLCLAATLHAQTPGNIIYLKNGSVIKGNVVESVPNQHIKIRTSDGSIFVYQMSDVDRIVMNEEKKNTTSEKTPRAGSKKGIAALTSASVSVPTSPLTTEKVQHDSVPKLKAERNSTRTSTLV